MSSDKIEAGTITLVSGKGDEIEAYHARPVDAESYGSVVVIHHMPGYDSSTKEIARRFAAHGYGAVVPNLFHRYAAGASAGDGAAAARAAGGVPDAQCIEDVSGAVAFLKAQPGANGKVGVIGYCSGGRQTYLAACNLDVDAAVVCYAGGVVATPDQLTPERPVAVIDMTKDLRCPMLGLFGVNDANPSPEHTARMEEELKAHGKTYRFHTYDDAGHAFFWVERPSYNAEASRQGWHEIWDFYGEHLEG
jgi:carboxymethylenebutenolidase